MKIGILIDSAATSNPKDIEGTQIEWIPLHVTFPNNTDMLDTLENIEKNDVMNRIANGEMLKTSQASPGELEIKYDEMLTKYEHIIHIPIPGNLSSMLQTAFMTASDEKYTGKVTVYDNNDIAAMALTEMALNLSEKNISGELDTPQKMINYIEENKHSTYVGIIPGDLKKLASGGRATGIIATVLNIFKTKLLIRWAAKPEKEAIGRTYSGLTEKVISRIKRDYTDTYRLVFMSTPLTSQKTCTNIRETLNNSDIKFTEATIPSIYTVHAGIESVAFAIMKK
ncbi:6-phosphogluconate dehydratase [Mesoplasma syrphidae]|uniref:6-phosphogluconate dehydratase n=1 Tax=Mesoplasma syrphidae TaxID=225999 RepID=A0A2K9BJ33_9MOLU|nr:DegV family protein [Mesoplasma syrphidae]AUF83361.1 6-phosphogluconate dehydratase [Mesoplasma syrphidae]